MSDKEVNVEKSVWKKVKQRLSEIIPVWAWIPLLFEFGLNNLVYAGSKVIAASWHHYNIESPLDTAIPFLPWTISVYFGCYVFWIVNYIVCVRLGKERAWRFLSADFAAKLICLVCFLVFPTTNTRPEVSGASIWDALMRFLYHVDSADNLFPSIHCLTSWFCYIGLRGQKAVPRWYRTFSCIFALAVFVSTLTTKQHVLIDVAAGAALAEGMYWVSGHTGLAEIYAKAAERVNRLFWKQKDGE